MLLENIYIYIYMYKSSIPHIGLREGGGRTRMRNKRWQVQDNLGTFFFQDACGVVPGACGLDRTMRFKGDFLKGLMPPKKGL